MKMSGRKRRQRGERNGAEAGERRKKRAEVKERKKGGQKLEVREGRRKRSE